jgi:hypothetical protein
MDRNFKTAEARLLYDVIGSIRKAIDEGISWDEAVQKIFEMDDIMFAGKSKWFKDAYYKRLEKEKSVSKDNAVHTD